MKSIKVLTLIISAIALLPAVSFANILNPNTSSVSKPQLLAQVPARIRLKTQFTGDNKCLDIINDGANNRPNMANCGNFSGQIWNVEPTQEKGFYRLKTQFTGENKCLDVINDGSDRITMANCANFSGQIWSITPTRNPGGFYKLKNQFTRVGKCLDIINDGKNNRPIMAACANFSGQLWKIN
jgi:Ricin-type beta-trefoil lectin domain